MLLAESGQRRGRDYFPGSVCVGWAGDGGLAGVVVGGFDAGGVQGFPDGGEVGEVGLDGGGFA